MKRFLFPALLQVGLFLAFSGKLSAQNGTEIIYTQVPGLGKAGPYSHAVIAANTIYVSGMIPINYETGQADTTNITIATHRIFKNIRLALGHCKSNMDEIVKVTVYLRDMNDFEEMNKAYEQWFPVHLPARTTVEVSRLPLNMPIEIEVIAVRPL